MQVGLDIQLGTDQYEVESRQCGLTVCENTTNPSLDENAHVLRVTVMSIQ